MPVSLEEIVLSQRERFESRDPGVARQVDLDRVMAHDRSFQRGLPGIRSAAGRDRRAAGRQVPGRPVRRRPLPGHVHRGRHPGPMPGRERRHDPARAQGPARRRQSRVPRPRPRLQMEQDAEIRAPFRRRREGARLNRRFPLGPTGLAPRPPTRAAASRPPRAASASPRKRPDTPGPLSRRRERGPARRPASSPALCYDPPRRTR